MDFCDAFGGCGQSYLHIYSARTGEGEADTSSVKAIETTGWGVSALRAFARRRAPTPANKTAEDGGEGISEDYSGRRDIGGLVIRP